MPQIDYEVLGGQAISMSMERYTAHLARLPAIMEEAAGILYETTRLWFDSRGDGEWAPLAESTIATKASQGVADPARPLYRFGNLYESVTSPSGPYSFKMPMLNGIVVGINWEAADILHYGHDPRSRYGGSRIPARRIWPPAHSRMGFEMTRKIGALLLRGHIQPAWPGARMGRGAGGRFVSLKGG